MSENQISLKDVFSLIKCSFSAQKVCKIDIYWKIIETIVISNIFLESNQ